MHCLLEQCAMFITENACYHFVNQTKAVAYSDFQLSVMKTKVTTETSHSDMTVWFYF